jgi:hypothetical protein
VTALDDDQKTTLPRYFNKPKELGILVYKLLFLSNMPDLGICPSRLALSGDLSRRRTRRNRKIPRPCGLPREAIFRVAPAAGSACFWFAEARPRGAVSEHERRFSMSDSTDFVTLLERHNKALLETNASNKAAVFKALANAGIATVNVTFDGEGDSGQIENILADGSAEIPEIQVELQQTGWDTSEISTTQSSLRHAIERLCYDYLAQQYGGWENNDGAFGEFIFGVAGNTIELEFNGRYSDVHTSSHTF